MMHGDQKIKILECIRQGEIGGGESHLLSLTENLDKNVFEPVILSFTDGPMIKRLAELGVGTYIIKTLKPFDFRVWGKVKDLMVSAKIDVVHAHGTRAYSNVIWAAKKLRLPIIYTIHGWSFHDDQNPMAKMIRKIGEQLLVNKSTVNIAVSESNRKTGAGRLKNFKATVVNNGIDQRKFSPFDSHINIRKEFKISDSSILLLFIARFTSHKQPLLLIKAFAQALKKNGSLKLLMVGEGDEREAAFLLAKDLGIESSIIFENFRLDVADILASADIFILPSLWEGLPIGLLEAMSMGKIIIATNVDGTSEIIKNEHNGLLIELNDLCNNLADAILRLASDSELRKRLSLNAMDTVKNKFNATEMTRQIEQIYLDVSKTKLYGIQ